MRAIGGADLDEPRAGLPHDVGNAERAADLDQLAARDDDLAPAGERAEHQQHGRGVVVDDGGGFGAGQLAQQLLDERVAIAAPARGEIEFEVDRGAQRLRDSAARLHPAAPRGRDWCAARCRSG